MRLLLTAGPTREPIDRVRYIGNRSSGTLGAAIAGAARAAGHEVTTLLGPVGAEVVAACREAGSVYRFESSAELGQLLEAHFRDADILVMAAAVADFRPVAPTEGKTARPSDPHARVSITLMPTPDLVARAASSKRPGQRVIAFALEEQSVLEERALAKMRRKGVDAIIANPLGTMEDSGIRATWMACNGEVVRLDRMSKQAFAAWLLAKLG
ncbi:phosphopantothenoylcysteine decarboxylase [Mucisphaera sp.]|uniref:phosphopantothenoylcysteine decarboxylase domain-containing protein n=1 Tax=Mucisphaera sp. TaxID=2913024 RepID=UPI003D1508FB